MTLLETVCELVCVHTFFFGRNTQQGKTLFKG